MNEAAAGQPSEKAPDFIPGWFRRDLGQLNHSQVREAVRILDDDAGVFPITFLRADESVAPTRPPGRGVTITFVGHEMSLAVPPGWWIVRDDDGELRNWRDVDFSDQWVRLHRPWVPAVKRFVDEAEGEAEKIASPRDACDHGSSEPATGHCGIGDCGFHDRRHESWKGTVEGWRGTPPAQGTRRRLILEAIKRGDVLSETEALEMADDVEAAMLRSTLVDGRAMKRGAEAVTAGIEKARPDHVPGSRPFDFQREEDEAKLARKREVEARVAEVAEEVADGEAEEGPSPSEESYEDHLLRQREEARAGEDHFCAQRDAALNCLRWTIGDLLSNGGSDDEPQPGEVRKMDDEDFDDRSLVRIEADRGLNHLRNAFASWMGL